MENKLTTWILLFIAAMTIAILTRVLTGQGNVAVCCQCDGAGLAPGDTVFIEPGDTVVIEPGDTVFIEPGDSLGVLLLPRRGG